MITSSSGGPWVPVRPHRRFHEIHWTITEFDWWRISLCSRGFLRQGPINYEKCIIGPSQSCCPRGLRKTERRTRDNLESRCMQFPCYFTDVTWLENRPVWRRKRSNHSCPLGFQKCTDKSLNSIVVEFTVTLLDSAKKVPILHEHVL